MLRFRHLALIFLFLSPAMAADEVPLEGSALLGDEDRAGGNECREGLCLKVQNASVIH
jgi:hypothetical protein